MSKIKEIIEGLRKHLPLVEMSNLRQKRTGINVTIYISTKQGQHGARVKIYPDNKAGQDQLAYILSVEREPKLLVVPQKKDQWISKNQLAQVKYWVWKNHIALLKLWNMNPKTVDYDDIQDLINGLEKV